MCEVRISFNMKQDSRILIVGHGAVENSLVSYFKKNNFANVFSITELGLNPTIQSSVYAFFQKEKPEYVFLGSTKSGGIQANLDFPADFVYHNTESQNNIFYAARKFGTKKVLYYASSCMYPKEAPQPMVEDLFLTGALEESSKPYAVAKIAGTVMAQAFSNQYGLKTVVMVPATIYGPGCDTDLAHAHVLGALIAKFAKAACEGEDSVELWGTGNPRREFIYVDDFVEASLFLINKHDDAAIINAGVGDDITIKELAETIAEISGFKGKITFDFSKPDGVKQKLLDSSRINKCGWRAKVGLREGIEKTYQWYNKSLAHSV